MKSPIAIACLVLLLVVAFDGSSSATVGSSPTPKASSAPTISPKRILAVFPIAGKSHMIFFTPLLHALARRGHSVTVYSQFPTGAKIDNYKEIPIKLERKHSPGNLFKEASYLQLIKMVFKMSEGMCRTNLATPELQELIHSNEKFDLLITSMFFSECSLPFAHKFDIPVVQMFSSNGMNCLFEIYGSPMEIAWVPDSAVIMPKPLSLKDRFYNFYLTTMTKIYMWYYHYPAQNEIVQELFGKEYPPVSEIQKERGSLLLVNTNLATTTPRSLAANVKAVGGIQLSDPKPLPEELQKWFDDSKDGVVYFSLGSAANPSDMPQESRDALFNVLGRLKQRVLFKWTTDEVPETFPNIRITQWAPQGDLLAHPNLRVFMSHGGALSSQEAVFHGVPYIGLPIFADQKVNAHNIASQGMGLVIELKDITEENLSWALDEVLNNPKYKAKAKHLSQLYHDQPMKPLDEAVFWTEYVMRHNGAKHLRSGAIDLAWWQRELVDVFAILLAGVWVACRIVKRLCRMCCKKGKENLPKRKSD